MQLVCTAILHKTRKLEDVVDYKRKVALNHLVLISVLIGYEPS